MSWPPSLREIELRTHVPLVPGQRVPLQVSITAERETTVEYVDLRIVGQQSGGVPFEVVHYPDLERRLMGAGVLAAGTRAFATSFELPYDMPPSHELRPAWARLEVIVDVAIPWWPDRHRVFVLPVRWAPPPSIEAAPLAARSPGAPDGPRLELSLASTRLVAGQIATGACAVSGLDDRAPIEVEIALIPVIRPRSVQRELESDAFVFRVPVPAGSAGRSIPFSFEVPEDLTPSFATHSHELAWHLVARTRGVALGRLELRETLEIVAAGAGRSDAKLAAAPPLSDRRIEYAFDEFAKQHGWREAAAREPDEQLAFERDAGEALLRLACVDRAGRGTRIATRVTYPRLGLGLGVSPSTRLRELIAGGIELGVASWDRAHHVTARSAEQVVPFLRAVVPALAAAFEALGAVVCWSDERIELERSTAGTRIAELAHAETALERIAAAIASAPVAPPSGVVVDLDGWRELAGAFGGRLVVGDLSFEGTLDQLDVRVALRWDAPAAPRAVAVRVGPAAGLAELDVMLAHPAADAAREPTAGPVRALVAPWPDDFVDLRIAEGIASAAWPVGADPVDPARVRELATTLRALVAALDPGGGPYR